MYIKYSSGFMIASLIQAAIIAFAEDAGLSHLGAKLTLTQLLIHILAGQVVGYILLFIIRKMNIAQRLNTFVIGVIWGMIVWAGLIPINAAQGKVKLPWEAGIGTVISSVLAFVIFGVIATHTIKYFGDRSVKESP
nr:hypothetical protein [Paenibacillus bovis]